MASEETLKALASHKPRPASTTGMTDEDLLRMLMELLDPYSSANREVITTGETSGLTPAQKLQIASEGGITLGPPGSLDYAEGPTPIVKEGVSSTKFGPGMSEGAMKSALALLQARSQMGEQERLDQEAKIRAKLFGVGEGMGGGTITMGDKTVELEGESPLSRQQQADIYTGRTSRSRTVNPSFDPAKLDAAEDKIRDRNKKLRDEIFKVKKQIREAELNENPSEMRRLRTELLDPLVDDLSAGEARLDQVYEARHQMFYRGDQPQGQAGDNAAAYLDILEREAASAPPDQPPQSDGSFRQDVEGIEIPPVQTAGSLEDVGQGGGRSTLEVLSDYLGGAKRGVEDLASIAETPANALESLSQLPDEQSQTLKMLSELARLPADKMRQYADAAGIPQKALEKLGQLAGGAGDQDIQQMLVSAIEGIDPLLGVGGDEVQRFDVPAAYAVDISPEQMTDEVLQMAVQTGMDPEMVKRDLQVMTPDRIKWLWERLKAETSGQAG